MDRYGLFFLLLLYLGVFTACDSLAPSDSLEPVKVEWMGQVIDANSLDPISQSSVFLVQTALKGVLPGSLVLEDTLQQIFTDTNGHFKFNYEDPDVREYWYSVHASFPNYIDHYVEDRSHPSRTQVETKIPLKPKSWLKIRVRDVPELSGSNGVNFYNLNTAAHYPLLLTPYEILSVSPASGDTVFYAFKQGGEVSSFGYFDADSMKNLTFQALLPPFDTTELTFTY